MKHCGCHRTLLVFCDIKSIICGDIDLNIAPETDLNPIISFSLNTWYSPVKQLKLVKELGLLKWIAFDGEFKLGRSDIRFKQWAGLDITALCTFIQKGKMRSFQDLKNTYDLTNQDLFRYLQMRDYYIKKIKMNEDVIHPIIKVFLQAYGNDLPRIVSNLYFCLMETRKNSTLYVEAKWERELSEEILEKMWYDMWKIHQTTTQSER